MKITKNHSNLSDINSTLDKMIQLEKQKNKVNPYKVILLIGGSVAMVIIVIALCMIVYKNNFSLESLLSLLLAFFSIFISIFFYFKADEANNRFYETSYNFMKDVSVMLGKIEERFGEKLNTLNDKVSHLSMAKEEKAEELKSVEDEKQKVIDELLDKAKLNEEQKKAYHAKLRDKEEEAERLRSQLRIIDIKYRNMMRDRYSIDYRNRLYHMLPEMLSQKEMNMVMHTHISDWSSMLKKKMIDQDFMMPNGELTPKGEILMEGLQNHSPLILD